MELVGGGRHGEDGSASGSRVAVLGGFGIRSIGPGHEETSVAAGGDFFTESAGDNVDVIDHGCVEGPPVADQDAVFEERTDSGDAVSDSVLARWIHKPQDGLKDLEACAEDPQDLGDSLPASNEACPGAILLPHHGGAEGPTTNHKWLTGGASPDLTVFKHEAVQGLSADILEALKLSDDTEPKSPPRKSSSTGKILTLSPVSVIEAGCWSPLAAATPLKRAKNI